MLIHELLHEENLQTYTRRLVKTLGIPLLGRGFFSGVFQHPVYHNVAVKVFDYTDTAYLRFLKFVLANQGNRWLPYVIDHVEVDGDDGKLHIVFMQKLSTSTAKAVKGLLREIIALLERAGLHQEAEYASEWLSDFSISNADLSFDNVLWGQIADAAEAANHDLAPVAAWLSEQNHALDLHSGNMRVRPDGQLVITDPIADDVPYGGKLKIGT
jgi:hypothetical protein